MKSKVTVTIAQREYTLISDEGEAYVEKVAGYVSGQIQEMTRTAGVSSMDAAVLAAANIADSYFKEMEASERLRRQLKLMILLYKGRRSIVFKGLFLGGLIFPEFVALLQQLRKLVCLIVYHSKYLRLKKCLYLYYYGHDHGSSLGTLIKVILYGIPYVVLY